MIGSVGNIQNLSIESALCSFNATNATGLLPGKEIQNECILFRPNTCPLKTEDHSGSDVAMQVKCEDPCPEVEMNRSSIWITHNG